MSESTHASVPEIIEASETLKPGAALTCQWPDGTETVETVSHNMADFIIAVLELFERKLSEKEKAS